MAVPQARTTRSKRGMRRSHDSLTAATLSINAETGETHRRHHVSKLGYYRGHKIIKAKATSHDDAHDHNHNHTHTHEE